MIHTRPLSSRHTSMKWLPVPSVPRCIAVVGAREHRSACSTSRAKPSASVAQAASTAAGGDAPQAPRSRLPGERPCGTARSIAVRTARRLSGRSDAVERRLRGHHAAADVDADRGRDHGLARRDDAADRRALADMHVRHHRQVAEDERHARCARELLARLVFDRYAPRPHLHGRTARDTHDLVVLIAHRNALPNAANSLSLFHPAGPH